MVDELIADLYVLDDIPRRDLFEYAKMLKKIILRLKEPLT